jgi:hypothetical protein
LKLFQAHSVSIASGRGPEGQPVVLFGHPGADGSEVLDFAVTVSDFEAAADFLARVAAALRRGRNEAVSQHD